MMRGLRAPVFAAVVCAGCSSAPLLAPSGSTLTLLVADGVLAPGGTTAVTATVVELAGTPVHDGTVVTFSATGGAVHPREAATVRGTAAAVFTAGPASGVAALRAFSGGAGSEPVTVAVGAAAAAAVRVAAVPAHLPPLGGEAAIVATVLDTQANPLPGVEVSFGTGAGTLRAASARTDGGGRARTAVRTASTTTVTASVGAPGAGSAEAAGGTVTGETTVTVAPAPEIAIDAVPPTPVAGRAVTFTVTVEHAGAAIRRAAIDFGDGQVRSLGASGRATASHRYGEAGSYTVTAAAEDGGGYVTSSSIVLEVVPAPLSAPEIAIDAAPPSPTAGEVVTFTVTVESAGSALRRVSLDFGDGESRSLGAARRATASHRYGEAGSYTVTASAEDGGGYVTSSSIVVEVVPARLPEIAIDAVPPSPAVGEVVTFTVTVESAGSVLRRVSLNFGDGESRSLGASRRATASHTYGEAGSYTVTATAEDGGGHATSSSIVVEVVPAPLPVIAIDAAPPVPAAGQVVTFTVTVEHAGPATWRASMAFGDGHVRSLGAARRATVSYAYARAGSYTATVTARDGAGRVTSASIILEVRPAPSIAVTIAASPSSPAAGAPVTFTVTVTPLAVGPAVRAVRIDFDDGAASSLGALTGTTTVAHVYARPGTYVVTVTVDDTANQRSTASIGVAVAAA